MTAETGFLQTYDICVLFSRIICPMSTSSALNLPPNSSNFAQQQQQQESHSAGLDDAASTLSSLVATTAVVSLWQIMYKVALESFMWGAGTALGELPPYFMARAGMCGVDLWAPEA